MSLGNLLSVGQSVRGTRDEGRYKMADARVLPKFAQVGRAISLAPEAKVEGPRYGRYASRRNASVEGAPAAVNQLSLAEAPQAEAQAIPPVPKVRKTGWLDRCNPFQTRQRPSRPLIQTEMLLESVKVVRNDLIDADLELVPRRPIGSPAPQPQANWAGGIVMAWRRVTSKLFGMRRQWR